MPLRSLPEPSPATVPFWDACKERKLLVQECQACGRIQFYPRSICTSCSSEKLGWRAALGTGKIYSYTTVHRALVPGFEKDVPYVVAMIELDEGVRMMSHIVSCAAEDVCIGMPVNVTFEEDRQGVILPMFRPILTEN